MNSRLIALALSGMLAGPTIIKGRERIAPEPPEQIDPPEPSTTRPEDHPYYRFTDDPATRLAALRRERLEAEGKRQGERIARRKHDFSASERCIERIRAKQGNAGRDSE